MPKKRTVKFPYTKTIEEAYELRVVKGEGCWGWLGYVNPGRGYAYLSSMAMHRWALEKKIGRPLAKGEQCRHLCGNAICTNPDHLEVGTQSDNEVDKQLHHNGRFGSNGFHKLTAKDAEQIRMLRGTMYQREIAEMFNITQVMVSRIQTGKSWNVYH
jgi:hypothetical protein